MGSKFLATEPPHIVVIPWPEQGHVNPAVQFSKTLVAKGLTVTLLTFSDRELFHGPGLEHNPGLTVEQISDEGILETLEGNFLERYEDFVIRKLLKFVGRVAARPCCVVYDSLMQWVLATVKEIGIMAAPFFTQPVAVNAVYLNVLEGRAATDGFPAAAAMEAADLLSFVSDLASYPGILEFLTRQLCNVREADWVFCNTVYSLEEELIKWMANHSIQMKSVGPTIPTAYLGKEEPYETTTEYGLGFFRPTGSRNSITQWLNSKPSGSVIYASLGSMSRISQDQTVELAQALHLSDRPFIWVVRESEQDKLPTGFTSGTSGLVVDWCHQLEVLAHPSVGCFVTHSGWNSTMEAISLGVPMVTLPVWTDQPTNAKFVGDVWCVGARAKADTVGGVVKREEIQRQVKKVMEGESGKQIRRNAGKWKRLAREAVAEGGSSDKNIDEFVAAVNNRH